MELVRFESRSKVKEQNRKREEEEEEDGGVR